ncbi:MAG: sigma-54 dependent transcriptional regulator [Chloroherpetonaceae bacterium]|nr:sigma-54 dependent transcriptional regulator [Chloroherpetonaceae bacterium]MCS7210512.1 sigma-54 dependent transcriptional regulator [Chloroherpetonaceae bacterium]
MTTVLVVDDEHTILAFIKEALSEEGYTVETASNGREALSIAKKFAPDIAILDFMMPDMNGLQLLTELRKLDESMQVLMLTAYNSVPTAVQALRLGAADYLLKPFELDVLKLAVAKLAEKISLRNQIRFLRESAAKRIADSEFILCPSPQMTRVYELAAQVAQTNDTTVLILGESGTGKEHVAKFVHLNSARKQKPFVEINCAAIPDNLLESELFGYEPGAFTDARSKKIGLFEYADGGTIFLDEIGDMPLATQAKILKVMDSKSFRRIGGLRDIKTDVRIIAATNKDLALAIEKGEFREDLYYRLQVMPITLPPLRERPDDILQLADFFLNTFSHAMRKRLEFSDEAIQAMLSYQWKGNVRELKNAVERAVIVAPSGACIQPEHLALKVEMPTKPVANATHTSGAANAHKEKEPIKIPEHFSLKDYLEQIEREHILAALAQTEGNQLRAAKLLGIERHVLRYQMKRLGIEAKSD